MAKYERFLFLLLSSALFVACAPADDAASDSDESEVGNSENTASESDASDEGNVQDTAPDSHASDEGSSTEKHLEFSVSTNSYSENGVCRQVMTVKGNGVIDSFVSPCTEPGFSAVTTPSVFVYGDPKDSNFSLFSDKPSTLVVIQNGKCAQKTYTITETGTTSMSSEMSDEDCSLVKLKMADELEKNRLYWEEWNKNFTDQMDNAFSPFDNQPDYSDNNEDDSSYGSDNPWGSFGSNFGLGGFWGASDGNSDVPSENTYESWDSEDNSNDDYSG